MTAAAILQGSERCAIVTGAAQGIGLAVCRRFGATGMRVGCLDWNADRLGQAVEALRELGLAAEPLVADIADRTAVEQAVSRFMAAGSLTVLVNNAAFVDFRPVEHVDAAILDRMFAVGVRGLFWSLQACLPHFDRAIGAGHHPAVVNVASAAAFQGSANASVYAAVKGAVASLTRQWAVELGPRGIRVNAVAPGPIPTEGAMTATADTESWRQRTASRTPLGRMGTADEIAAAIEALSGDAGHWINGQVILVDGGKAIAAHDRL